VAGSHPSLELELPSDVSSVTKARHAAAEFARGLGAPEGDVKLAVSEAVGNSVVHAFRDRDPGTITLRARADRGQLIITVADDGTGMRPNLQSRGLGLGISLITKLANDVRFDSTDAGTTVSMSFSTGVPQEVQ
jgi:serine/threonine-protein kinase RsbW/stage II sporulation protein AB (anti-sigma F factor)